MNRLASVVDGRLLLGLGLVLAVAGLAARFARDGRRGGVVASPPPRSLAATLALVAIVAGGAWLRLDGLDEKSLNHTEMYVPGIPLPAGISEPPPRHTLAETVGWHFHDEPHPQGYYFLTWGWTKLFGASVFALRLPSVLFGVASIALVYRLAALAAGPLAGLLAAAMLALHGLQIFWSQMARMYEMTSFLGLLSALLLVRLAQDVAPRPGRELAYLAVTFWGVFTEILFWPFLAAQMLWTAVAVRRPAGGPDRLLHLQAFVVMLGAPLWAHAAYRSRAIDLGSPRLEFLGHYLGFGFLYEPDPFAVAPFELPAPAALALLAGALALYAAGLTRAMPHHAPGRDGADGARWPAWLVAVGAAAFTFGLALLAHRRRELMAWTALLPFVALALPRLLAAVVDAVAASRRGGALLARLPNHPLAACAVLALAPPAIVFALSYSFALLQSRLFLVYTPYLLVLAAAGAARLAAAPARAAAVATLLLAVHGGSAVLSRDRLSTPRDYKSLAHELEREFRDGDLVFAPHRHWGTTPLFYYLERSRHAVVTKRFGIAVQNQPSGRVFVVLLAQRAPSRRMQQALAAHAQVGELQSDRGRILIYARPAAAATAGGT